MLNVLGATFAILHKSNINKKKKFFLNEQKVYRIAVEKRTNTSGIGISN